MPEAFKNIFSPQLVENLAWQLKRVDSEFDALSFASAVNDTLESLELKQRSALICEQLSHYLSPNFEEASAVLLSVLGERIDADAPDATITQPTCQQGVNGWAVMPLADYVAKHGMSHFELSMTLLKEMTKRSSSEFAIRPFLDEYTDQTMRILQQWAKDDDEHVRRLASEGCRPRLPWGMRLRKFVKNPESVLVLLDSLKDDPSEYVRRSVANNLNDISKDHPDAVANVAQNWLVNASENRARLVRHACRSLIKAGHPKTLEVLGYGKAELGDCTLVLSSSQLNFGSSIYLSASIESQSKHPQSLMIDFIIHHQKANGTTSAKVFKWRTAQIAAGGNLTIGKKHTIKPITTRTYYPGIHKVELQVNGHVVAHSEFDLVM